MSQATPSRTSRRTFLRGTAAAAVAAPLALPANSAEAELFALEPKFTEIAQRWAEAEKAADIARNAVQEWMELNPEPDIERMIREAATAGRLTECLDNIWEYSEHSDARCRDKLAAINKAGLADADEAFSKIDSEMVDALNPLFEIPATTLEGLILKARMVRYDETVAQAIVDDLLAMGQV